MEKFIIIIKTPLESPTANRIHQIGPNHLTKEHIGSTRGPGAILETT